MKTKRGFKWSNFLQGGMMLYAGGFFLLYRFLISDNELSVFAACFGVLIGFIFLIMATGFTFFGDVGGVLDYFQEKKEKQQLSALAKKYHSLSDKEFENQLSKIIEDLPPKFKYRLLNSDEVIHYFTENTSWSSSKIELFIKEINARK